MWTVKFGWLAIVINGKMRMTSPGHVNVSGPSRCATTLSGLRGERPSEGLLMGPGGACQLWLHRLHTHSGWGLRTEVAERSGLQVLQVASLS